MMSNLPRIFWKFALIDAQKQSHFVLLKFNPLVEARCPFTARCGELLDVEQGSLLFADSKKPACHQR